MMKQQRERQSRYDKAHMRIAMGWAKLSYSQRKQVGAIMVKDRMIISDGYNGTPTGFDNCCEGEEDNTHWFVLHAEVNAIMEVTAPTQSSQGTTLYITISPCKECSKLIHQSGIRRIVYKEGYRDNGGSVFLEKAGVGPVYFEEVE